MFWLFRVVVAGEVGSQAYELFGVEGVITGARPIDCERNLPIRKMPALEAISLMLKLKRGIGPEIWIAIVFCILY